MTVHMASYTSRSAPRRYHSAATIDRVPPTRTLCGLPLSRLTHLFDCTGYEGCDRCDRSRLTWPEGRPAELAKGARREAAMKVAAMACPQCQAGPVYQRAWGVLACRACGREWSDGTPDGAGR